MFRTKAILFILIFVSHSFCSAKSTDGIITSEDSCKFLNEGNGLSREFEDYKDMCNCSARTPTFRLRHSVCKPCLLMSFPCSNVPESRPCCPIIRGVTFCNPRTGVCDKALSDGINTISSERIKKFSNFETTKSKNFASRDAFVFTEDRTLSEKVSNPVIAVQNGKIRGKTLISRDGKSYLAFLGVPYAKSPIGDLRFKPAESVEKAWDGVLDCTNLKPECIQMYQTQSERIVMGSEDCLYLNVYTPKKVEDLSDPVSRFPVIVFIHGGINAGNGSKYRADYFMDEDVILVMVHYRLHVFGNLNTGDSEFRGNYGIKDQVMALKWIQRNVAAFGGDKERVTLYGNSYGAMCVSTHFFSPMSKGLFHGAILQSGNVLTLKNGVNGPGMKEAMKLGAKLGCPRNTSRELVNCLRLIDAKILTLNSHGLVFRISIETKSPTPELDNCLPDDPLKLMEAGLMNPVPSILGITSGEGMRIATDNYKYDALKYRAGMNCDERKISFLSSLLQLPNSSNRDGILRDFCEFYLGPWDLRGNSLLKNLTNMFGDRDFNHPTLTFTRFLTKAGRNQNQTSFFLYYISKMARFTKGGQICGINDFYPEFVGVPHGYDVQYLLPCIRAPRVAWSSSFSRLSKYMVKSWVNFARTGKPNEDWQEAGGGNGAAFNWFEFNDTPRNFQPFELLERMAFLDRLNLTTLYSWTTENEIMN